MKLIKNHIPLFALAAIAVASFAACRSNARGDEGLLDPSELILKGTVAIGGTVSAEFASDGDASGFSYQWILLDAANKPTDIKNAKSAQYTIPDDVSLIGQKLKVQAARDDSVLNSAAKVIAATSANLAINFGIITDGIPTTAQVTDTFDAIHAYVSDSGRFNKTDKDTSSVIKLGDYIDLPQLVVAKDESDGGAINKTDVRLIVIGINSFNGINGNDKAHVVFHFQDLPGKHRMNSRNINTTGYLDSEMRAYIVNKFLPGLKTAGVPDSVLWAPNRIVASRGDETSDSQNITDELWLPTEREILGSREFSVSAIETADNQANFTGYYKNNEMRKKDDWYYLASPWSVSPWTTSAFCSIYYHGSVSSPLLTRLAAASPLSVCSRIEYLEVPLTYNGEI